MKNQMTSYGQFRRHCNIGNAWGIYYVSMLIGDYYYIGFITYFVAPSVRVSYYA